MAEQYPPLPQNELDDLAQRLTERPSPHYPIERLTLSIAGLAVRGTVLFIPEGPWETRGHPNRLTAPEDQLHPELPKDTAADFKLDPELTASWLAQGYLVDQYGRAINPYWQTYLSNDRLGLTTGPGMFWRYGNNGVTDALIPRLRQGSKSNEPEWLLVQRRDSGEWATPGGYTDVTDKNPTATAAREVEEETGLRLIAAQYSGQVMARIFEISRRVTLNSWSEINVVLIEADQELLHEAQLHPDDDARDVMWSTYEYAKDTLHMPEHYLRYIETAEELLK